MTSSHRTATRRRNLVRTSAIAAVAGSALLLPAAAAFADSPAPANPASPNAEQDKKQDGNQNQENGTPDKDAQDKSSQDGSSQGKNKGSQDKDKGKDKKGERSFVRAQNLAGGFTAKIYKLGQNHYQADMYAKAPDTGKLVKYDTLETTGGKPAYGQHNGAHFVLQPDGAMTSWVEGGNKKPDHKDGKGKDGKGKKQDQGKATPKNQGKVIPKGGVKAGAEGVQSGDHSMLLAGGGAATAAAGLGFAALHRRKAGRSGNSA
ncbi:hypothetical protein [Streptomyces noursei]|uniref:hypothetical protein n=1 Tax=Streptomyces noursei TaxID=1971 RepID=UPI0019634886|nr:hypothetical protein [Streptomyces noursei]QRX95154.1 hypothetical protein JNO44_33945 [Streptomyces noursei]